MRESYVRPVTGAREPAPEWHAVWRFRAVALVLLVLVGWGAAYGINQLIHVSDQDPTSDIGTTAPESLGTPPTLKITTLVRGA
jgi:hypothetical protein